MSKLEEDMRLGDLSEDMHSHTRRLGMAMPYTLLLIALGTFGAIVMWFIYTFENTSNLSHTEKRDISYQASVVGFLIILSYAVTFGAMNMAHSH